MPRLSAPQLLARDQIVAASRTALTPETFAARVATAIGVAVPYDDTRMFAVDPGSRLLNRLLYATYSDGPFRQHWLKSIYLSEMSRAPYFAPQVLMDEGISAVTFRPDQSHCYGLSLQLLQSVDQRTHWHVFHDTRTPIGGSMRLLMGSRGRNIGIMDVVRREGGHPFSAPEFTFLRSLVPAITKGLEAALAFERAIDGRQLAAEVLIAGVLILDLDGTVTYASKAGEEWVRRFADYGLDDYRSLPTAVWAVAAMLRSRLEPAAALTVPIGSGFARIEATEGQKPGEVVVVMSSLTPPQTPVALDTWPLTQSERKVVGLMLLGKRNRAIATELFISEHTVEAHLAHAYEKIGVHSRGELLARLFTEQFLPEFESGSR